MTIIVLGYPFDIFKTSIALLNQSRVRSKGVRLLRMAWEGIMHFGTSLHFSEVTIYRGKWPPTASRRLQWEKFETSTETPNHDESASIKHRREKLKN